MKINLGPKVDLFTLEDGSYKYQQYFDKFAQDYGRSPEVVEFQLLWDVDINNPKKLIHDLDSVVEYVSKKGVSSVSFHYPAEYLPVEAEWKKRTLKELGMSEMRPGEGAISRAEAQENLHQTIEIITNRGFGKPPILVVHQAGVQLEEYFKKKSLDEIDALREEYAKELFAGHKELLKQCGDKLIVGLENVPSVAYSDNEGYLFEQAVEHFLPRLKLGGMLVLDLAHAALCCHYQHQQGLQLQSMDSIVRQNYPSLESLEKFIELAGPYTELIHLCDAKGARISDEGLAIGVKNSIINWPKTIKAIEKYVKKPKAVLEIVDAHINYEKMVGKSLKYLNDNKLI